MTKLASLVAILLLLCGAALWFLASGSLNPYIKTQIETVGHDISEQTVAVAEVDLQLGKGIGTIKGLSLSNPKSYSSPYAFLLSNITLAINTNSLIGNPIVIDRIIIEKPELFVEFSHSGASNISDILKIIKKNTSSTSPHTVDDKQPPSTNVTANIRIAELVLNEPSLTLELTSLGNHEHNVTINSITLSNIGGASGLPADKLGAEIAQQLLSTLWQQVKNEQKKVLTTTLKDKALNKLETLFGGNE